MKTFRNIFLAPFIGLCITLLIAACIDGCLWFVAGSIICTAGISLIVWFPVWWFMGSIVLGIIDLFRETPEQPRPSVDRDHLMLTRYITQALAAGRWSREQIDEHLRQNGWTDQAIERAHRATAAQGS